MSSADDLQRDLARLRRGLVSTTTGQVTAQDWDNQLVTVDLGGTPAVMGWSGSAPWPGDEVRVMLFEAGQAFCELIEGAPMGTVQSVGSSRATVLGDDGVTYTYPYVGAVPAPPDRVGLLHSHRVVLGLYSTEPADSEFTPKPAPPPTQSVKKRWFDPVWSGNWSDGVFKGPQAQISSTRLAAFGWGTQIRDTIPNGANVYIARLYLTENWDNVPGVASSMGLHAYGDRPLSIVNGNLSGSYSVPGLELDITGSVMAALQNGSAFGVGFRSGSSGWREYGSARIFAQWN